jgi:hypothetical protein
LLASWNGEPLTFMVATLLLKIVALNACWGPRSAGYEGRPDHRVPVSIAWRAAALNSSEPNVRQLEPSR